MNDNIPNQYTYRIIAEKNGSTHTEFARTIADITDLIRGYTIWGYKYRVEQL